MKNSLINIKNKKGISPSKSLKHMRNTCHSLRSDRLRKPNLVVSEKSLVFQEDSRFFLHNKKAKLNRFQLYIIYFLVFSFLGWILETLFAIYNLGYFVKRGFLYGPICPIYGYGALMLILFLGKYKKNNIKLFIYSAILFSVFEYFASYLLDALFAMHWWNYTNDFFNLNGRISVFYSFAWGIIAILFINYIFPFFKKKINMLLSKIGYSFQLAILYVLFGAFVVDTIVSVMRYLC